VPKPLQFIFSFLFRPKAGVKERLTAKKGLHPRKVLLSLRGEEYAHKLMVVKGVPDCTTRISEGW